MGPYISIGFPATSDFIDSTGVAGVGYFYRIRPRFADATEGRVSSVIGGMLTGTLAPTGLSVLSTSGSSVSVGWVSVPGATQYRARRSLNIGGPFSLSGSLGSVFNSYSYSSLSSRLQYYFQVGAMVSGVEYFSAVLPQATLPKPDSPVGDLGNNQIDLQWSPLASVLSYSVERSVDTVNFTTIATGLGSSSYLDTGLTNGQIYFYRVTANYALGAVTSDLSDGMAPGVVPLSPSGVHIDGNSIGTTLSLGWAPVTGSTGYYVYMSTTAGGPYGAPQLSTGASSGVQVSGLTPGTLYYFVITTRAGNVQSAPSSEVSALAGSTPPAPMATCSNSDRNCCVLVGHSWCR